jgi:RNA polymerase sigma factor for flagellar operon FliA
MSAQLAIAPTPARTERQAVLLEYYTVVQKIAGRMVRRLPPNVDKEELVQEGMIGLMDAHERYDQTLGVPFKAYAETRIQGAMYDWLRKQDMVPRSVRRKANAITRATDELTRTLDRDPTREELAAHLEKSVEELEAMQKDARIRKVVSLDVSTTEDGETPLVESLSKPDDEAADDSLFGKQVRGLTYDAIAHLPDRERHAINLYHVQGFTLKETGKMMGVTESRACQLTKQAIKRLRFRLRDSVHPQ